MAIDLQGIAIDVVRAEASRFRHPLLLVHGLWTGGWIWRDAAPYLAHRGWDAWIPTIRADGRGSAMDLAARRKAVEHFCRDLPASPIVVTHDAGVVVADAIASDLGAPAVVSIAPVMGKPSALTGPRFWATRLGSSRVGAPVGRSAGALLAGLTQAERALLCSDSGSFFRSVASADTPLAVVPHGLVVAALDDPAASRASCERIAHARGWDVSIADAAGHFPMLGAGATGLVDRIHRWIVRTLGGDVIAWLDDEREG